MGGADRESGDVLRARGTGYEREVWRSASRGRGGCMCWIIEDTERLGGAGEGIRRVKYVTRPRDFLPYLS